MRYYEFLDKADIKALQIKEQIASNVYDDIAYLIAELKFNLDHYTIICVAILVLFLLLAIVIVEPRCFRRWKRRLLKWTKTQ